MNPVSATDSYLNLLLSLPNFDPITILAIFFLTVARILPIMTITPFLGAKNLPMVIRMMFSIALVSIFIPQNVLVTQHAIGFSPAYIGLLIKELAVGAVIGILASAPFFIAQMAGSLIDHSRGSSALQVNDPTTQTQTGPIGILFNFVLIAIFYALNGPFIFFNGVADSYRLIPVDRLFNPDFFNLSLPFWKQIMQYGHFVMSLSIQISAPALIGILLTDMFLGIANRLAPQVQIVFLGISLKSWVGIALMTAAWALMIRVMGAEAITWTKHLHRLIDQVSLFMSKS